MTDTYLTPQQVAERYQVSAETVREWVANRGLQAFRCGNVLRISAQALEQFDADRQTVARTATPLTRARRA